MRLSQLFEASSSLQTALTGLGAGNLDCTFPKIDRAVSTTSQIDTDKYLNKISQDLERSEQRGPYLYEKK